MVYSIDISFASKRVHVGLFFVAMLIGGCTHKAITSPVVTTHSMDQPATVTDTLGDILHVNQMGIDIAKKVNLNHPRSNLWLSPACLSMALRPVYMGANGTTKQEITPFLSPYTYKESSQLEMATSLWVQPQLALLPDYLTLCRKQGMSIFQQTITAQAVNHWVREQTHDKISHILSDEEVQRSTLLVASAIYFKGEWMSPFHEEATRKETFFLSSGDSLLTDMMHQTHCYPYYENDSLQMVILPYEHGSDHTYTLTIILPSIATSASRLLQAITAQSLSDWEEKSVMREVILSMPRVKFACEEELNATLQSLGIISAFLPNQADFSRMSTTPLYIDKVKQCTFLSIDEQGTEAAAVTTIGMRALAMPPAETHRMNVNRPYLLFLQEHESKNILFVGKIENACWGEE